MNKTPNYALNQWEADDRVLRTDFNADNAKIDAALGKKCEIACGTYTGDGAASRTISLGFTPKAVLVITQDGHTRSTNYILGGLALTGSPAKIVNGAEEFTAVAIISNGFRVYYDIDDDYYKVQSNFKDRTYHYIAIA